MTISVLTPTIDGRQAMLVECMASVAAQTYTDVEHVVRVDQLGVGPAAVRNLAAVEASGDWLAFLDDDDLFLPHHLETLALFTPDFDVIYSIATIQGRPGFNPQRNVFDADRLRQSNYIPCTGMVRRSFFEQVGGFPDDLRGYEDYGLWLALLDAGARFVCVPETTWIYRFGSWDSRSKRHRRARGKSTW